MMTSDKTVIRGGALIAASTLIAGVGGYAITIVAARYLSTEYVYFAAFWAFLYLAVGTFSGFQQEVTRGTTQHSQIMTRNHGSQESKSNTWLLATAVAFIATICVSITAWIFGDLAFSNLSDEFFLPLVVGVAANVFIGALTGILYGISSWWPLTLVIVGDVALRFTLLVAGFAAGLSLPILAWLIVAPYGVILMLCWAIFYRRLATHAFLDIDYKSASLNIMRTILASLGIATLVSGMPLFIASLGGETQEKHLSAVIFSLILTRAPLVVGVLALQSFLVVYFRDHSRSGMSNFWKITGVIIGAASLVSLLAWGAGADVISLLSGESFRLDPGFIGILTFTSLPTAILAITGAYALSQNFHTAYSSGWLVAALVAAFFLQLPLELDSRVLLSLGIGPLVGLVTLAIVASAHRRHSHTLSL